MNEEPVFQFNDCAIKSDDDIIAFNDVIKVSIQRLCD